MNFGVNLNTYKYIPDVQGEQCPSQRALLQQFLRQRGASSILTAIEERKLRPNHEAALVLGDMGFRVFPLNGKLPALKGYQAAATADPAQIDQWWTQFPVANVGAMVFNGEVVVDIDPRNRGNDTWDKLNRGFTLPQTLTTRTSRGGRHLRFKLPYNLPLRGTAGPGIDLKNSRQYTVMPGSTHPVTGEPYLWETLSEVAMLPDHLVSAVFKPHRNPGKSSHPTVHNLGRGLLRAMAEAQDGQRNNVLFWAGCRAYEDNLNIEDTLVAIALEKGLHLPEIEKTLASAKTTVMEVR